MVALYAWKIQHNEMTIEEVPLLWREKVRIKLEGENID